MEVRAHGTMPASPADLVPYGAGFFLPRQWSITASGVVERFEIDMHLVATDSHPEVVELTIRRKPDGPPIQAADLRTVRFGDLKRIAVDLASWVRIEGEDGRVGFGMTHLGEVATATRSVERDRRRWLQVDLAEIADVHRSGGRKPVEAVMKHFGITSRKRANTLIREARDAGLIPPARRTKDDN